MTGWLFSRGLRRCGPTALAIVLVAGLGPGSAQAQKAKKKQRPDGAAATLKQRDTYGYDYSVVDRNNRKVDMRGQAGVNGYQKGYEAGQRDRRGRAKFNYREDRWYRDANIGWNDGWGNRQNDYRIFFRQFFVQGYSDGYYRRARNSSYRLGVQVYDDRNYPYDPYYTRPGWTNSGRYSEYYSNERGDLEPREVAERAAQNGYYAGYQRGLYDAQRRNRPNPQGHGAWQFALDGFDPEWGSASTYRAAYRDAFVRGYDDAFGRREFDQTHRRRY